MRILRLACAMFPQFHAPGSSRMQLAQWRAGPCVYVCRDDSEVHRSGCQGSPESVPRQLRRVWDRQLLLRNRPGPEAVADPVEMR